MPSKYIITCVFLDEILRAKIRKTKKWSVFFNFWFALFFLIAKSCCFPPRFVIHFLTFFLKVLKRVLNIYKTIRGGKQQDLPSQNTIWPFLPSEITKKRKLRPMVRFFMSKMVKSEIRFVKSFLTEKSSWQGPGLKKLIRFGKKVKTQYPFTRGENDPQNHFFPKTRFRQKHDIITVCVLAFFIFEFFTFSRKKVIFLILTPWGYLTTSSLLHIDRGVNMQINAVKILFLNPCKVRGVFFKKYEKSSIWLVTASF